MKATSEIGDERVSPYVKVEIDEIWMVWYHRVKNDFMALTPLDELKYISTGYGT